VDQVESPILFPHTRPDSQPLNHLDTGIRDGQVSSEYAMYDIAVRWR
jgi:hypothetical protein